MSAGQSNEMLKELLRDYPALINSADENCWKMLKDAQLYSAETGTILYNAAHDDCSHLMLIVEGIVRVFKESTDGRELTLYRVEPGQLCIHNLNNLIDGMHYPIMAQADTFIRGLVISSMAFRQALNESNSFRNYVLRTLTERLANTFDLISGFAFERLDIRVACWLGQQFERSRHKPIQITHNEIAHELGTTREMISRILKDFEHKKCIQLARGKIHLVCEHTLQLAKEGKAKIGGLD